MMDVQAQTLRIGDGGDAITGPLKGVDNLGQLISLMVNRFLLPTASFILLGVIVWAGYDFIISRGDPNKLKSAKSKLTYGIIGFVLIALSYFIVNILSYITGLGRGLFE